MWKQFSVQDTFLEHLWIKHFQTQTVDSPPQSRNKRKTSDNAGKRPKLPKFLANSNCLWAELSPFVFDSHTHSVKEGNSPATRNELQRKQAQICKLVFVYVWVCVRCRANGMSFDVALPGSSGSYNRSQAVWARPVLLQGHDTERERETRKWVCEHLFGWCCEKKQS